MKTLIGRLNKILKSSRQQKIRNAWGLGDKPEYYKADIAWLGLLGSTITITFKDGSIQACVPSALSLAETELLIAWLKGAAVSCGKARKK